jgi:hypothetical protein
MDDGLFVFICLLVLDDDSSNNLHDVHFAKSSKNLWESLKGITGRGRFLSVTFRIHLEVPGKSCTGPRMTRG